MWYTEIVEFIESAPFTRKLHRCAGENADAVLRAIQEDLQKGPERGAMVPGLGGVRKARMANPGRGKGKRGGFRYLYLHLERRQHVHLLILLDKNEQEDLSEEQRAQILRWVEELKKDSGEATWPRKSR
jgi:mRNA-degrading endonuclease RelE of RelBE toxin-antitoxin system